MSSPTTIITGVFIAQEEERGSFGWAQVMKGVLMRISIALGECQVILGGSRHSSWLVQKAIHRQFEDMAPLLQSLAKISGSHVLARVSR